MTETTNPTVTPEEEKRLAEEAAIQLGSMIEREVLDFTAGLSPDVKVVTRGNATSIKHKNKNFVYIMKGKRVPLSISVKENNAWKKLELKAGAADEIKNAVNGSFQEVTKSK